MIFKNNLKYVCSILFKIKKKKKLWIELSIKWKSSLKFKIYTLCTV